MIASAPLRVALLAAGLALAAPAPCLAESQLSRGPGAPATARLMLQVGIPAFARMRTSGQPGQLAISPDDLDRGFVDVPNAGIEVVTNQRGEKRLVASIAAAFARSVEITGLMPQAVVAGTQGTVRLAETLRGVVDRRFEVSYRIHLDQGMVPGIYPWPVLLRLEVD